MKRMNRAIKAAAAGVIAACLALQPIGSLVANAAEGTDYTLRVDPTVVSTFNDTNNDGLGEFQGFGTSLCWWANRIGYSDALTDAAGRAFFSPEDGLGMAIGRYNVGGGDDVSADYVRPTTSTYVGTKYANTKANFYGISDATYAGSNMSLTNNSSLSTVTFSYTDADFGFIRGTEVGDFNYIGWINKLGDAVGSGDNLHFNVNAAEAGNYTVKIVLTLTGSNTRDVAIRVNGQDDYVVSSDEINSHMIASGNKNMLFVATISNVALNAGENTINVAGKDDWTLDFVKMAVIKSGDEAVAGDVEAAYEADKNNGSEEVSDPFLHAEHIIRSDAAVPGSCVDVTRITSSTDLGAFDQYDTELGYAWNYDWNADANQLNVLRAAIKYAGSDFLAEAFSNSPPYFMTVSGCSSGAADANSDNLRSDAYGAFAKYMADVIEHWCNEGIIFTSTDPMNEPYTNYWGANSNKQEGCHFDLASESKIIVALNAEMSKRTLNNGKKLTDVCIIAASDETSIDTAITAYKALTSEAKAVVSRVDTHTYSGSKRAELASVVAADGKNLWMSEVDGTFTAGTNAGEMTAALGLSERMFVDINGLQSSAWILWNAIDMHADSSETGMKYVNLGSNNDYRTMDELVRKWMPNSSSAYWGLAAANHDDGTLRLTQKYYAFGQLSRYVRPGMTIMGSNSANGALVAYDPQNSKLVVVANNTKSSDKSWKLDLSRFNTVNVTGVQAIRTSGSMANGEHWADVSNSCDVAVNNNEKYVTATMKANSITTFIIDGVSFDASNPVVDNEVEIALTADMVIDSSTPWNNGADVATKVVDGNLSSFFDGLTNGYLVIDLGEAVNLSAIGYCPRSGYESRMNGGVFSGSVDNVNWTPIFTVESTPSSGTITKEEVTNANYRYIKYSNSAKEANIAEIKLYRRQASIASSETVYATCKLGKRPNLPTTVNVILDDGNPSVADIAEWSIEDEDFANVSLYDVVTVQGSIAGSSAVAEAKVIIASSNTEYFIDCNRSNSTEWQIVKNATTSLLNTESADMNKTNDSTWGRLSTTGGWGDSVDATGYDGDGRATDLYGFGWCAHGKKTIAYEVTLPKGIHEVNVGAFGYWSGRTADIYATVNGKESKIGSVTCESAKPAIGGGTLTLDEAATVTITVKEGNGGDPNISFITVAGPGFTQAKTINATVCPDGTTTLPNTVEVTDGTNTQECEVSWNVPAIAPANRNWFDKIAVTGDVTGHDDVVINATLTYVPSNLVYFVDCNGASDPEYKVVADSQELKNEVCDQAKTADNAWGRLGSYSGWNDSYANWSGWYAGKNQNIEYTFTLEAGKHTVYTGMQGSWWSSPRAQDYYLVVDGEESLLYSTPKASSTQRGSASFFLDKESEVTLVVKGNGADPVLSWIMISKDGEFYDSITGVTGAQMYDTDGNRIQAHGGQITKLGDTYYWIGEDKTEGYQPCYGVHMYSSKDLYNWTNEGLALKTMTSKSQFENDSYFKNLYGDLSAEEQDEIFKDLAIGPDSKGNYNTVIERPKMLYNEKTGKYVMWFHCDGKYPDSASNSNYAKARAGIAIADSPAGPYKYLGSYLLASGTADGEADHSWDNEGGHVRDMNLYKDEDGTAYVLYSSEGNTTMYIAKLNDSYTGLVKDAADMVYGEDFNIISTASREAPAMFKYDGLYYLITSQCTGWAPNVAGYHIATDIMGKWTSMGDPVVLTNTYNKVNNVAVNNSTTLYTQPTCVVAVDAAKGQFFYMGDRWFNPDNNYDISDSRYVWLPLEFGSNGQIILRDYSNWTLSDLENKGTVKVETEIAENVSSYEEFVNNLPETIDVEIGGVTFENAKVETWVVDEKAAQLGENFFGDATYTAVLEESIGRNVSMKVRVVPEGLVYFADCNTGDGTDNVSEMFASVAAQAKFLQNKVSDQADDGSFGYTSVPGAAGGSSAQDMGSKGEGDFYETGWWATDNGQIQYNFKLQPGEHTVLCGFNEWWSATRGVGITAVSVAKDGTKTTLGTTSFTLSNQTELEKTLTNVVVPEDSDHVLVTISKKSNQAPILSWIAVTAANTDSYVVKEVDPSQPTDPTPSTPSNPSTGSANNSSSNDGYQYPDWSNGKPEENTGVVATINNIVRTIRNVVSQPQEQETVTVVDDEETPLAAEDTEEATDEVANDDVSNVETVDIADEATPEAGAANAAGISNSTTFAVCVFIILAAAAAIVLMLAKSRKVK